ncbi:MAG TPA: hypothetical protein VH643_28065 [Gemmataceae bacterium]|jgi:hypothetical protein
MRWIVERRSLHPAIEASSTDESDPQETYLIDEEFATGDRGEGEWLRTPAPLSSVRPVGSNPCALRRVRHFRGQNAEIGALNPSRMYIMESMETMSEQ